MIKNNKVANMAMGLVVALAILLAVLLIYFYIIPTWIVPLLGDINSCEVKSGHCYAGDSCSEIGRDFLSSKASDCKEGEVCCSGAPVEYELQGGSGSSSQSTCAKGKICYTRQTSDGVKTYITLDFWNPSASNNKNCMWEENVPEPNSNIPKEQITITASAKGAKCCRLKLGGIETETNDNKFPYFAGSNPKSDGKGTIVDGLCTAELTVNFASLVSIFNFDIWNKSKDNYMGGDCSENNKRKAMFKLDWSYWTNDDCSGTDDDLGSAISSSVLMNVPALDPEYEGSGGAGGQNQPGGIHSVTVTLNERNFLFDNDRTACEFICIASSTLEEFDCDFAAVKYVDTNENCPTTFTDYSNHDVGINKYFVENDVLKNNGYIINNPGKKLCFMGAKNGVPSNPVSINANTCNRIYYLAPKSKISPTNICDDFECNSIDEGEYICNYFDLEFLTGTLGSKNSKSYNPYFCADKNCYFGEDPEVWSWITTNNCKDCEEMEINQCSDYNLQQACYADSCGVATSSTNLCYWDEETDHCNTFSCNTISNCDGYSNFNDLYINKGMCNMDSCGFGNCLWLENSCVKTSGSNSNPPLDCETFNIDSCEDYTFTGFEYNSVEDVCSADPCSRGIPGSAPCYWNFINDHCEAFSCSASDSCDDYNAISALGTEPAIFMCEADSCNLGAPAGCVWDNNMGCEVNCLSPQSSSNCLAYGGNQEWCESDVCFFVPNNPSISECMWDPGTNHCASLLETGIEDYDCPTVTSCENYGAFNEFTSEEVCSADPCARALYSEETCFWDTNSNDCRTPSIGCDSYGSCEYYSLLTNSPTPIMAETWCQYDLCEYHATPPGMNCNWKNDNCYDCFEFCDNGVYNSQIEQCEEVSLQSCDMQCFYQESHSGCKDCPNQCENSIYDDDANECIDALLSQCNLDCYHTGSNCLDCSSANGQCTELIGVTYSTCENMGTLCGLNCYWNSNIIGNECQNT